MWLGIDEEEGAGGGEVEDWLMECSDCQQRMVVVVSRPEDGKRYRRYRCEGCKTRIITYEIIAEKYKRLQSGKTKKKVVSNNGHCKK